MDFEKKILVQELILFTKNGFFGYFWFFVCSPDSLDHIKITSYCLKFQYLQNCLLVYQGDYF